MKITRTTVERIDISEIPRLDPIRVMLEDVGPEQGRINIECYGQAWSAYWGGLEDCSVARFFGACDSHYLAGKLSSIPSTVFDHEGLKDQLKRELIDERRKLFISKQEARTRFRKIDDLSLSENVDRLWHTDGIEELMGEEWWYRLPVKENPDYAYLCRIIEAVQAALREVA